MSTDTATRYQIKMGHDMRFINEPAYQNLLRLLQKLLMINVKGFYYGPSQNAYQQLLSLPLNTTIDRIGQGDENWTNHLNTDSESDLYNVFQENLHPSIFKSDSKTNFHHVDQSKFFEIQNLNEFHQILFPEASNSPVTKAKVKLSQIDKLLTTTFNDFKQLITHYAASHHQRLQDIDDVYILHMSFYDYNPSLNAAVTDGKFTVSFDPNSLSFSHETYNSHVKYEVQRADLVDQKLIPATDASPVLVETIKAAFSQKLAHLPKAQQDWLDRVLIQSLTEYLEEFPETDISDTSDADETLNSFFHIVCLRFMQHPINQKIIDQKMNRWDNLFQTVMQPNLHQDKSLLTVVPKLFDQLIIASSPLNPETN